MKDWFDQRWDWFRRSYQESDLIGRLLLFAIPSAIVIFGMNFLAAWIRDNEKAGQFGDSFGIATSLFSGAAFAMLVASIWLQRQELSIVKEERDETRKILKRQQQLADEQRSALDEQLRLSRIKSREDQFFAMANLIANELQRLNATRDYNKTYLTDAFLVVNRIINQDCNDSWDQIRNHAGNGPIYQCMPLCKLFGAAYEVAEALEQSRQSNARDVLQALAGDHFIQIYACIVRLRGEHKTQMSRAFAELGLTDLLPQQEKIKLEQALNR